MKTTSLELSKWLYEHGVVLETEKYWWEDYHKNWSVHIKSTNATTKDLIPAPSTDELLAVMPYKINKIDYLIVRKTYEGWYVQYWDYEREEMPIKIRDDSLPEALGLMVKYLIEEGYVYDKEERWLVK